MVNNSEKKFEGFFDSLSYLENDHERASEVFRYMRNQKQFLNKERCPCCHKDLDFSISQEDLNYLFERAMELKKLYRIKMKPIWDKQEMEHEKRKKEEREFFDKNQEQFSIAVRKRIRPNIKLELQDYWDWGIEMYLDNKNKDMGNYEELLFN